MRVLCAMPNCSEDLDGRTWEPVAGGMLSEDLPPAVANRYLTIPGFAAYHGPEAEAPSEKKKAEAPSEKKKADKT